MFLNSATKYATCVRQYVSRKQIELQKIVLKSVKVLKLGKRRGGLKIDPSMPVIKNTMLILSATLLVVTLLGSFLQLLKERCVCRWRGRRNQQKRHEQIQLENQNQYQQNQYQQNEYQQNQYQQNEYQLQQLYPQYIQCQDNMGLQQQKKMPTRYHHIWCRKCELKEAYVNMSKLCEKFLDKLEHDVYTIETVV